MQFKLILGNRVYSGWSLRAWLVFKHFGIDFEYEVVPLYTDEFEKFRKDCLPARQLPTLIATEASNRQVIWDSLSIVEFLNELHPDAEIHSGFKALRAKMPVNLRRHYTSFIPDDETLIDIERICDLWRWVGIEFNCEGPYLFGENLSAADIFFAPVASRFRTYSIDLDDRSRAYTDLLLRHPATVEFVETAQLEFWIMEHNEFDLD